MSGWQYTVWADTPDEARNVVVEYLIERAAMRKGRGPLSRTKIDKAVNEAIITELTDVANFLTTVSIRSKKKELPDANTPPPEG